MTLRTTPELPSPMNTRSKPSSVRETKPPLWSDPRLWATTMVIAVAVGCLLRVLRFIDNPALWLDEAFLSINLLDKSFGQLLGELQFLQSAPPGFLIVEKLSETVLGDSELSLRLFPLIASLTAMVVFAYVAHRMLAAPAAALATLLFAVGEPLLERTAEVKPYSVDVAVAVLVLALTLRVVTGKPEEALGRLAALGAVGITGLWLSFPTVFSLAAAIGALGVFALETRSRLVLVGTTVLGALALTSFAAVYLVASSNVSRISSAIFDSAAAESALSRADIAQDAWSTFVNPGGFDNGTSALAALLACLGAIALGRRGSLHLLALFVIPPALALLAAGLDRYPLGGRFSLFLVPYLLVLVARGAQELVSWSRRPVVVAVGLTTFLAASQVAGAAYRAFDPPAREDIRPLVKYVLREWQDGDQLYVYPATQYALRYHSTCEDCSPSGRDFPWPTRIAPASDPGDQFAPALESVPPSIVIGSEDPDDAVAELEHVPRPTRIWLLFSHVRSHGRRQDGEQRLLARLEQDSAATAVVRARGARLYLFTLPTDR